MIPPVSFWLDSASCIYFDPIRLSVVFFSSDRLYFHKHTFEKTYFFVTKRVNSTSASDVAQKGRASKLIHKLLSAGKRRLVNHLSCLPSAITSSCLSPSLSACSECSQTLEGQMQVMANCENFNFL